MTENKNASSKSLVKSPVQLISMALALPPGWSIRPCTDDDLEALERLDRNIQKNHWTRSHFEAELQKPYSHVWVCTDDETDEKIAAYIVYWVLDGRGHLYQMGVDPEFQRQGFAQFLIRKAWASVLDLGAEAFHLELRVSNAPALQLYQKLGFYIKNRKEKFYSDGEAAYEMALGSDGKNSHF